MSSRHFFAGAFALGLAAIAWVGFGFIGASWLALAVTALIAVTFVLGAWELAQFRAGTQGLARAVADVPQPLPSLADWLATVPAGLRNAVRLRVEGERVALPGPALTPYLVGLLVMLGMLGTFLGMVVTFQGAVFALEGSSDLQAMRSALAAPIKGLGLSFGTSVAGVAASAMLGLMSAIARRERMEAGRALDQQVAAVLAPFSLAHQRNETFRAVQAQARALPQLVGQLEAVMERIEQRSARLDAQLLERHADLQQGVTQAYAALARSVGASLQETLAASAEATGRAVAPVVESAMVRIVGEAQRVHERLGEVAREQVDALSRGFGDTARGVSQSWTTALELQGRTSEAANAGLQRTLAEFSTAFAQRSTALLADVNASLARSQQAHAAGEQERLQAWTASLQGMAAALQGEWRRLGDASLAQQREVALAMERSVAEVAGQASTQAARTLAETGKLLDASSELVRARTEGEARWMAQHGQRMDELAALWRSELAALRQEESQRGQAAVDRLETLQGAVAQHLATLGAALEAPLTRLLQTASEVPQAAAGVIAQLRAEMGRMAERDNLALTERTTLLERLGALLQSVNAAAGEQRAGIAALVDAASTVLAQASERFAQALEAQSGQAASAVAQVAGSAVELASLAEGFQQGVQGFQASNDQLMETLQRIEASLNRSTARSDEQLAYYVAQAREVIDLSIASQQGLVENLRQLQARPAAVRAEPVAEEARA